MKNVEDCLSISLGRSRSHSGASIYEVGIGGGKGGHGKVNAIREVA